MKFSLYHLKSLELPTDDDQHTLRTIITKAMPKYTNGQSTLYHITRGNKNNETIFTFDKEHAQEIESYLENLDQKLIGDFQQGIRRNVTGAKNQRAMIFSDHEDKYITKLKNTQTRYESEFRPIANPDTFKKKRKTPNTPFEKHTNLPATKPSPPHTQELTKLKKDLEDTFNRRFHQQDKKIATIEKKITTN